LKEKIKAVAKISAKSLIKWGFIIATGIFLTFLFFSIALFKNAEYAGGGHGNVIALAFGMLIGNFPAFLLVFCCPAFIMLYFVVANKIAVHTAINGIWKAKAGDVITSKVESIIKNVFERDGIGKSISDKAILKTKLLQANKSNTSTSKIQRKVISYGLKKMKLDDIDFQNENLNFSQVLSAKFNDLVSNIAKPTFKLYWILLIVHIGLFIFSLTL